LADPGVLISTSVYDDQRRAKLAVAAVRAACAPVLVVCDPIDRLVAPGDRVDLDVHVVNDLREAIDFAVVDVTARWETGRRQWRFGGSIPADGVVKVGDVTLEVPDCRGALLIDLELAAGDVTATNAVSTVITDAPVTAGS
jgi:hypothetical protein